jgi:hypothetical protein
MFKSGISRNGYQIPASNWAKNARRLREWDEKCGWLNEIDSPENDIHRIPYEPQSLISFLQVTPKPVFHHFRMKNVQ